MNNKLLLELRKKLSLENGTIKGFIYREISSDETRICLAFEDPENKNNSYVISKNCVNRTGICICTHNHKRNVYTFKTYKFLECNKIEFMRKRLERIIPGIEKDLLTTFDIKLEDLKKII